MVCRAASQAVSASFRALSAAVRVEVNCSKEGPVEARCRCLDLTLAAIALSSPCKQQGHSGEASNGIGDGRGIGAVGWGWGQEWGQAQGVGTATVMRAGSGIGTKIGMVMGRLEHAQSAEGGDGVGDKDADVNAHHECNSHSNNNSHTGNVGVARTGLYACRAIVSQMFRLDANHMLAVLAQTKECQPKSSPVTIIMEHICSLLIAVHMLMSSLPGRD